MINSLNDLYKKISDNGPSDSPLQFEGLVSSIRLVADGIVDITIKTEEIPSCQELLLAEKEFERILDVREVIFVFQEKQNIDSKDYLKWAERHIEKYSAFDAAILKNCMLSDCEGGIRLESAFSSSCSDMERLCGSLQKLFKKTFKIDLKIIPVACSTDVLSDVWDLQKNAVKRAVIDNKASKPEREDVQTPESPVPKKKYRRSKKSKETIWGRMAPEIPPVKMNELHSDTGYSVFEGEIFSIETRVVSSGTKTLIKFNISDGTNSIKCSVFMDPDKADEFICEHSACYLRIHANVGFDFRFEKDLVAKVIGIEKAKRPPGKKDTAETKRVELHCHTKMSSKDSVCDVKDLVSRAVEFGHSALAITDHGVVQAFPEARKAALDFRKKGKSIKIIYGMEAYLSDDGSNAAYMCDGDIREKGFIVLSGEFNGDDPSKGRVLGYKALKYTFDETVGFMLADRREWIYEGKVDEGYNKDIFLEMAALKLFIGESFVAAEDVLDMISFFRYEGYRTKSDRDPTIKFFNGVIDTAKVKHLLPESEEPATIGKIERDSWIMLRALEAHAENFWDWLREASGGINTEKKPSESLGDHHCTILARDEVGLYGLYRMVSGSHVKYMYKGRPRIKRSEMLFFRTGNLYGSACEAGEIYKAACDLYDKNNRSLSASTENFEKSMLADKSGFYDFLEVMPVGNNEFMLRDDAKRGEIVKARYRDRSDLENINLLILHASKRLSIPVCATGDVHFIDSSDKILRSILQTDSGYSDADLQPPLFFRTTDEMLDEFSYFGNEDAYKAVIGDPSKIAGMVKDDIKPFPEGSFPPSVDTAEKEVTLATWAAAVAIFGDKDRMPSIVSERIEKELKSIIGNGFAIMYYIAMKLVKKSNDDGYIVGSRGSVGSSLVAKLCGITEVDPLPAHYVCSECKFSKFDTNGDYGSGYDLPKMKCPECGTELLRDGQDIPFETFLGFEGEKQPDIDLNFSGEYQPVAHKFIEEMFGHSHTFRAGTITGFAEMNTAMMVKNYMEKREEELTGAEASRLAGRLEGVKRTTGQHPGGIVVVPKDREIYDFTPIQCPADKTQGGIITTHFDFNSLHDTILKLDILGHDDPTMLKMLGDMTGIDVNGINITDEKIMKLMRDPGVLEFVAESEQDCGTLGLPEMGTFMARGMIKETQPSRFYDLVQLMGLSHGKDVWNGNARELIKEKTCTVSDVIGCRDGIMTTLVHKGLDPKMAFGIMEAVRKGRGLTTEQESSMREHKVPEWYITSCKKIKYMFPKAHAAAYSISALRIAWFKIYRKAEYYCAYFTVRADDFDYRLMCADLDSIRYYKKKFISAFKSKEKVSVPLCGKNEEFSADKSKKIYYILELVEEMLCRGIAFSPLDIYKSEAARFIIGEDGRIRPPLNTLPSVSGIAASGIVNARKKYKRFISREDFARKAGVGESVMTLLEMQGCLDSLPKTTQMDIFSIC